MPAIAHNNKILGNTNSLDDMSDVSISTPSAGQVLGYDGSEWKNTAAPGGGGSIINVTTTESSLHGKTVTLTDGTTTLSSTFDNNGKAQFTGVTLTGSLTLSSSDGTSTATNTFIINFFGVYTKTLSFFTAYLTMTFPASVGATCTVGGVTATTSPYTFTVNTSSPVYVVTLDGQTKAGGESLSDGQTKSVTVEYGTINLTFSNEFRGQTITCTKGGTTITKTAPSGSNSMAFYPPTTGTWVISGTYSGTPYSTSATVSSLSTPVPASLQTVPNGKTATPTDDIQKWLECGQISGKSYTTLAEVLADTETYNRLLSDSNACDYMARSTTWASTLCADAQGMFQLGKYDYACDALLADSTWASAICNSTYWESVLQSVIPTMTGYTTPSGECFASSEPYAESYQRYAWKPFGGFTDTTSNNNVWSSTGTTGEYVGYGFADDTIACRAKILIRTDNNFVGVIQGSNTKNDGYETLTNDITFTGSSTTEYNVVFTDIARYKYYRLYCKSGSNNINIVAIILYGRHEAHAGKLIHTAYGNESVYRMVSGSPQVVCTATDGVGTFNLPAGTYTLYSTTAKDPDNLTDDYSKTVTITDNTTDIYLMPDNALYWWGYESSELEDITSANGWSYSGFSFNAPTHNTTSIRCSGSSSTIQGVGTKYALQATSSVTKLVAIGQGVTLYGNNAGGISWQKSKDLTVGNAGTVEFSTTSLTKIECTSNYTGNIYASAMVGWATRAFDLNALYAE